MPGTGRLSFVIILTLLITTASGAFSVGHASAKNSKTPAQVPQPETSCTIGFADVHPADYYYEGVRDLYCLGAINGYSNNTFLPGNTTSRGQVSEIAVLAFRLPINTSGGPHFSDVPTNDPFYSYIETAYNRGVLSGYSDGTFHRMCL